MVTPVCQVPTPKSQPCKIAALIALGTAIFIAYQGQDNLQKWLERCLWRRVPQHIPIEKWPEIYPTMWMEMDEFKRALGQ
ncbi:hypothetical protein [Providencia rettgeri]|uniref:hypothetical protein n=1 Tax=Providencia rettgeri TaxID=587 RepID=UPI00235F2640|nr:hypothetical protein [Providencia rettgeri]